MIVNPRSWKQIIACFRDNDGWSVREQEQQVSGGKDHAASDSRTGVEGDGRDGQLW